MSKALVGNHESGLLLAAVTDQLANVATRLHAASEPPLASVKARTPFNTIIDLTASAKESSDDA